MTEELGPWTSPSATLGPSRSQSGSPPAVSPTPNAPTGMNKQVANGTAGEDTRGPKQSIAGEDPGATGRPKSPKGWHHRGYLPHFDDQTKIQTITYRLADSLPQKLLQRLAGELDTPDGDIAYRQRIEDYLDRGYGSCCLKNPETAEIVIDSWLKFDAVRYDIYEYVVMPNHVHLLMATRGGFAFTDIIKGFKSFTAREINRRLGRQGQLWQEDYWDRYIRNTRHFEAAARYIHENPVKAGLVKSARDWPWSSAGARTFPMGARVSPPATTNEAAKTSAGEDTRAPRSTAPTAVQHCSAQNKLTAKGSQR